MLWREWHRNRPARLTRLIWWAYFAGLSCGGAAFVAEVYGSGVTSRAEHRRLRDPAGGRAGPAPAQRHGITSLSEERTRGTLDVLLATPLSTQSIVWGKWWGAFRVVPLLAFWPTVVMAAFAFGKPAAGAMVQLDDGTRAFSVVLMALIVLVHGAAITSLGLALATWIPRPGRAVGLTVVAYVLVSVGWMILILILVEHGPRDALRLAGLSPIFAAVDLCQEMIDRPQAGGLGLRQHLPLAARRRRSGRALLLTDPRELRPLPRPDLRVNH